MLSAANLSALNVIPYIFGLIILGLILAIRFWKAERAKEEQTHAQNKAWKNILLISICIAFLFCAIQIMRIMG